MCSLGAYIVKDNGYPVAGCLAKTDVTGDDRLENTFLEVCANIVNDLSGEVVSGIEHGEEDAFQEERGIETSLYSLDCLKELG